MTFVLFVRMHKWKKQMKKYNHLSAAIPVSTGKTFYCPHEKCLANMTDVLPVTIHQTNDAAADSI